MSIQTTEAVLLKKKDFRETSFLVTFFTKDFGKLSGILKGARGIRAKSGINPLFFSRNQIVYYEKKRSSLFIISQCDPEAIFFNILNEWKRASIAYYILELVDVFTEPSGKSEEIFKHLVNSLTILDKKKEADTVARIFEVKFLMALGLWPGVENFRLTKGAMSTLGCFENSSWDVSSKIKLTSPVAEEIENINRGIISDNLDRPLKTLKMPR